MTHAKSRGDSVTLGKNLSLPLTTTSLRWARRSANSVKCLSASTEEAGESCQAGSSKPFPQRWGRHQGRDSESAERPRSWDPAHSPAPGFPAAPTGWEGNCELGALTSGNTFPACACPEARHAPGNGIRPGVGDLPSPAPPLRFSDAFVPPGPARERGAGSICLHSAGVPGVRRERPPPPAPISARGLLQPAAPFPAPHGAPRGYRWAGGRWWRSRPGST